MKNFFIIQFQGTGTSSLIITKSITVFSLILIFCILNSTCFFFSKNSVDVHIMTSQVKKKITDNCYEMLDR